MFVKSIDNFLKHDIIHLFGKMKGDVEMKINLDNTNIQEIKGHTKHKIALVVKYVENWLEVASNRKNTKSVCFIDGMCNAGIYSDGTLGTSTEVLKLFTKFAKMFPNINYYLFCNDIDSKRIEILRKVLELKTNYKEFTNIKIFISNEDVNNYILNLLKKEEYFNYDAQAFTLLFLDPYNFGTIELKNVKLFLKKYYAELMYNFFISDIKRNANNEIAINKKDSIKESMIGLDGYNGELDYDLIKQIIIKNIQQTKTKKYFSYQFKICTNVEIYNIMFFSPQIDGIKKLKDVLWEIFDGDSNNYRLLKEERNLNNQITLFDDTYIRNDNLSSYLEEAKRKLIKYFYKQEVTYKEIEDYLLCNTMLKSTHIINHLIKPLINNKEIIKRNYSSKSDYKNDKYFFN